MSGSLGSPCPDAPSRCRDPAFDGRSCGGRRFSSVTWRQPAAAGTVAAAAVAAVAGVALAGSGPAARPRVASVSASSHPAIALGSAERAISHALPRLIEARQARVPAKVAAHHVAGARHRAHKAAAASPMVSGSAIPASYVSHSGSNGGSATASSGTERSTVTSPQTTSALTSSTDRTSETSQKPQPGPTGPGAAFGPGSLG